MYAPTVGYPFVWEDTNDFQLVMQPWTLDAWLAGAWAGHTRIVAGFLRGMGYALSGVEPWGYHLMSVSVHLLNGVLFAVLAHRVLAGWWASFAVGLFLLHPLQVESVAYISSQADLVSVTGLLVALLCAERGWVVAAWLACAVAVLGKETAVAGFALVPVWLLWRVGFRWAVVGWFAASVVPGLYVMGRYTPVVDLAWMWRLTADLIGLLSLWVVPYPLSIEHDWSVLRLGLGAVGIVAACVVSRPVRWAVGACVVLVLPRVLLPQIESLHEHHAYPMVVGLSLSAGWIGAEWDAWRTSTKNFPAPCTSLTA